MMAPRVVMGRKDVRVAMDRQAQLDLKALRVQRVLRGVKDLRVVMERKGVRVVTGQLVQKVLLVVTGHLARMD